jgi:hypothetical protein
MLRGAHFSPDTPGVDVYLTSFSGGGSATLWLADVGYGDVSSYESVKPGVYAVSMRAHGASPNTPAALSWTLNAVAGQAYTAAAVGMNSQLKGIVLHDDLSTPAAGHGLVRVIQAASRAPVANIAAANGPVLAQDAAFATSTEYVSVNAGTWPLRADSVSTPSITTSSSVSIAAGSVNSVVLLDGKSGGITLTAVLDAGGTGSTPTGSINAGGGGTAQRADGDAFGGWRMGLFGGGLALVALGAIGLKRRRPARQAR